MITLQFLGAAETVTGSKYLVTIGKYKLLVDCGFFQGNREWRERNWEEPPFDPKEIDAVLLTHAHVDHTGMLPRYVSMGLKCPVYATPATISLTKILLEDSAELQEEEAAYRAARNYSRHPTPLPLYTIKDAKHANEMLKAVRWENKLEILPGVFAEWKRMGHILGAGSINLTAGESSVTFSGDIGRYGAPILVDPKPVQFGNHLLIEATYGDRFHSELPPQEALAKVVHETVNKHGILLIPCFAVGRAQQLLYYFRELKEKHLIPDIPIIVDSPMARDATDIYLNHPEDYDESALGLISRGRRPFQPSKLVFTAKAADSIKLNSVDDPMIIIAGSGMLSGGRILHHLKHRISNPRNTVLFVGYQSPGGRGAWLKSGAPSLRLFGKETMVKADIREISGLSAHGDQSELLRWCRECSGRPDRVTIVHAEPESARTFKAKLEQELSWNVSLASYLGTIKI